MPRRKNDDDIPMIAGLIRLGVRESDIPKMRQVSRKLHRWHEMECDGRVSVADDGRVEWYNVNTGQLISRGGSGRTSWETVALKKLGRVMASYPELAAYVQGIPAGRVSTCTGVESSAAVISIVATPRSA